MTKHVSVTEAAALYWDNIADNSELERVPDELPQAGGFEYLVAPSDTIRGGVHATGGYDTYDDQTGTTESLVIVNEDVPRHVRGLMVAHLVLHKFDEDDGQPTLCGHMDRGIQSVLSDADPQLIGPFYDEMHQMYREGYTWFTHHNPSAPRLVIERYERGLKHAKNKGKMADEAGDVRKRLEDAGLILPDGETALNAVDKRTGERTHISLQTERATRHKCKNCSHPIVKGAERITTSTRQTVNGYDHHHYHPGCFTHVEFGVFGDLHQDAAAE